MLGQLKMNTTEKTDVTLLQPDRAGKIFIVVIAVIQALLLYLAQTGKEQQWGFFAELHGMVYWYSLVLAVPTVMLLSVQGWRQWRFWLNTVLVALLFTHTASWALYNATGAPGIEASAVLLPFGITQTALLFILLPFLQSHLLNQRWQLSYPQLFSLAWQNAITLLLTLVFVGLSWLVLQLGASLFALIELTLLQELLRKKAVVYLLTGLMVGLGILLGRTQHNAINVLRNIVFAMFKGLLPLLAFIAVTFVFSLPFTGLEPLWATRHAAAILISLQLALLLFINAVAQTGTQAAPYPRFLRYLINAALCCLPVFALLALYAIYLRLNQYGITQDRVYALLLALVLAAHAVGYCLAALRPAKGWLPLLGKVNISVAFVAVLLLIAINSPLLDPQRLTASSQIQRLQAYGVDATHREYNTEHDIYHLRFDTGRPGYQALQQLQQALAADDPLALNVTAVLARPSRYRPYQSEEQLAAQVVTDLTVLKQQITVADWVTEADDNWWQALLAKQLGMISCLQPEASCTLLQQDLDQDGQPELILCDMAQSFHGSTCRIYVFDEHWFSNGSFFVSFGNAGAQSLNRQLLAEPLPTRARSYPDILLNDRTIRINTIYD